MKNSLTLVLLLPVACTAHAADALSVKLDSSTSLALYGTLDSGVWVQNKATDTTDGATIGPDNAGGLKKFHSGGISPSRWGIKGNRELSDDRKLFFTLEAHLLSGTGSDSGFGDSGFTRQALVGLSGRFGTVTLGQQFTPATLAFADTDPRGLRESLSGLQPWLYTSNPDAMTSNLLSAFAHNSIEYQIDIDKLHLGVLYGLGGKSGSSRADGTISAAGTYKGPVTISSGYQSDYAASGKKGSQKIFAGIGMTFGPISPKATFINARRYDVTTGAMTHDYRIAGVGVDWKATDSQNINLSVYRGRNDRVHDNRATSWILSDEYAFDSSLTLYGQVALINAKSAADIGVSVLGSNTLVQGATTAVVNAGLRFNF